MKTNNNGWQFKSLGELLASLESGGRAKGGSISSGIPSIGAEHLNDFGRLNFSSMKYVSNDYYNAMNKGKIFKGDILVVKDGATTGKVSLVDNDFPFQESAVNEHVFIVRTNKHLLDPHFAFYYLYSSIGKSQILADFRGSAQGGISRGFVDKVHLPLPPLPIQKQIAEILEKADEAKQRRKEANKLTDEFLQSVFIEMFGDPIKNPKGWETKILNKVCKKITDGTHDTPQRLKEGIKFITGKNIRPFYIDFADLDYVNEEVHKEIFKRCNPEYGDILYTNIGINVGTAVMNDLTEAFSMKNVALLKNDTAIIKSRYLEHLLNNPLMKSSILHTYSIGGAQSFLSLSNIKRIQIPIPQLSLQQQFAEIVNKTEALKEKQKQSEQELENLFQSLMQRAFKGELVS